jgi:hypothetical protein
MTCSERGKVVIKCKEMVKIDILGGDRTELRQYKYGLGGFSPSDEEEN